MDGQKYVIQDFKVKSIFELKQVANWLQPSHHITSQMKVPKCCLFILLSLPILVSHFPP